MRDEVRDLTDRLRNRRLYKRACVFPRCENEAEQEGLVKRFFATGGAAARTDVEERITDLLRFATGKETKVIVYCPAKAMQLKEARIHVRWPGEDAIRPLSTYSERVPRLGDLEQSYRNLWKFYVFADTDDPARLAKIAEIAQAEFAEATNAYDAAAGS